MQPQEVRSRDGVLLASLHPVRCDVGLSDIRRECPVCVSACMRVLCVSSKSTRTCVSVCVTVRGRWGSVSGSVCVCVAETACVCLPGAASRGGREAGGWTAARLPRRHLQTEQKHTCYLR